MEVNKSVHGRVAMLEVRGPMIEDEIQRLDQRVEECVQEGLNRIVVDLAAVPFIDSSGLEHLLQNVTRLSKSGGNVRVTQLNDVCRDIFLATGMGNYIIVIEDNASAIRSLL